ncbi:MAG: hypothetical protein AB7K67_19040, partial [Hyphomicrobiaceae bacterium]
MHVIENPVFSGFVGELAPCLYLDVQTPRLELHNSSQFFTLGRIVIPARDGKTRHIELSHVVSASGALRPDRELCASPSQSHSLALHAAAGEPHGTVSRCASRMAAAVAAERRPPGERS